MPCLDENHSYYNEKECRYAGLLTQAYFEKILAAPDERDIADSLYSLTTADVPMLQRAWKEGDAKFGAAMRRIWEKSFKSLAQIKMRDNWEEFYEKRRG